MMIMMASYVAPVSVSNGLTFMALALHYVTNSTFLVSLSNSQYFSLVIVGFIILEMIS